MGVLLLLLFTLAPCYSLTQNRQISMPHPVETTKRYSGDFSIYPNARPNGGFKAMEIPLQKQDEDLAEGIVETEHWSDNEEWFNAVDEVDVSQTVPLYQVSQNVADSTSSASTQKFTYKTFEQFPTFEEDFCGENFFCDGPPPPVLHLPPPPLPPFMENFALKIMEGQRISEEEGTLDPVAECSLCQWAEEGNSTLALEFGESDEDFGLAGLLAGVAVGSAVTGAILTAVLIRCRRAKILPSGKETCPVLSRGSWGASKEESPPTTETRNTDTTTRTGWAMKLWRRASSQETPLQPPSSYSSENSYTEEPYMNPEVQSAVYAELSSSVNTYSEIPDPGRPENQRRKLSQSEPEYAAYGNNGYCLSESLSDPAESSSTPSSAYYSDVSADLHANKKKRKKKKINERDPEAPFFNIGRCAVVPPTISSTVPMMQSRINDNVMPLSGEVLQHNRTVCEQPLQLSLRYLSRSYSLERPASIQLSCTSCHSCTPISTLPIVRHSCPVPPNTHINLQQLSHYPSSVIPSQQPMQNSDRIPGAGHHGSHFLYSRDPPPPCCGPNSIPCATTDYV